MHFSLRPPPALRRQLSPGVQSPLSAEGANGGALALYSRGISRLARTWCGEYSCACVASDCDVSTTASPIDVEGDTCHHVLANGPRRARARVGWGTALRRLIANYWLRALDECGVLPLDEEAGWGLTDGLRRRRGTHFVRVNRRAGRSARSRHRSLAT